MKILRKIFLTLSLLTLSASAMDFSEEQLAALMQDESFMTILAQAGKFDGDLANYFAHPAWVSKAFLRMVPDVAVVCFTRLVEDINNKDQRWHYLYDEKDLFEEDEKDINSFLDHMKGYYTNFSKMALNLANNKFVMFDRQLIYKRDFEEDGVDYLPLIPFFNSYVPNELTKMFAIYFKYLSFRFIHNVKRYHVSRDQEVMKLIESDYMDMLNIFIDVLKDTQYEPEVMRCLMKYDSLKLRISKNENK